MLHESQVDDLMSAAKAFPGYRLVIDLAEQTVATTDGSLSLNFDVEPFRKECLLNGLDEIALTLKHSDTIRAFENKRLTDQPWLA